jgi:hypothetical protein
MKLGFTGTREGMTEAQKARLVEVMARLEDRTLGLVRPRRIIHEFHHGACKGADAQAVLIVKSCLSARIVAHPSDMRWTTVVELSDEVLDPKPPIDRNRDVVDACDHLFACPKESSEERRSGTWMTIRYARKVGKPLTIICPDGTTTVEKP